MSDIGATGYANGDLFTSEQQVREYFTIENMIHMFGDAGGLTQGMLDTWAGQIISTRDHCAF